MTIKERWHNISRQTKQAFNNLFKTGRGSKLNQSETVDISTSITRKEEISIPVGPLKAEDLEVKVQNGYLIIAAKKSWSENLSNTQYRGQAVSRRMISIGRDITPEMVEARMRNGHLLISVPYDSNQLQNIHRQIKIS